jgi:hypothetical protein
MARVQARLPDPSRIGFGVLLLLICTLILVNSIATTAIFYLFFAAGVSWLKEPRIAQPVLFMAPLLLLCVELWAGARLGRLWSRGAQSA